MCFFFLLLNFFSFNFFDFFFGFFYFNFDREGNQAKSGGKVKPKIDITAYNISLSRGLINLINDPDEEFEPYFNDPQQIMRIFQDLEEKNLYLIRISQVSLTPIKSFTLHSESDFFLISLNLSTFGGFFQFL